MTLASSATSKPVNIAAPAGGMRRLILEPKSGWQAIDLGELVRYRDLLRILAMRDIRVRYKQTALGAAWAIIQPLVFTFLFTFLFGSLAGFDQKSLVPYPLIVLAALVPWQLFATSLGDAGNSLIGNSQLISKVYFPRLVIPLSCIVAALLDFAISFLLLIAMMIYYGVVPQLGILLLPLFLALALAAAFGVGLWASALNVEYRDVRYVLPFLTQVWMLATPVMYPVRFLGDRFPTLAWIIAVNPMYSVVEGFRWALLGTAAPNWGMMALSILVTAILLLSGLFYFRRMERTFADLV